jgi:hypothetical protein
MEKRKTEKVREREPVYKLLVELVLETFRYKQNFCFFLHFMDEVVVSFHDLFELAKIFTHALKALFLWCRKRTCRAGLFDQSLRLLLML